MPNLFADQFVLQFAESKSQLVHMVSLNLKRRGVASATSPALILEFHQQRSDLGRLTREARYDRGKLAILSLL